MMLAVSQLDINLFNYCPKDDSDIEKKLKEFMEGESEECEECELHICMNCLNLIIITVSSDEDSKTSIRKSKRVK